MWWNASLNNRLIGVGVLLVLCILLLGSVPTLVFGQTGTPTPTEYTLDTVIAQTLSVRASVTARASAFTTTPSTTPNLALSAAAAISASDTAQAIASFTATPCPPDSHPVIIITQSPLLTEETARAAAILATMDAIVTQTSQALTPQPTATATPCNNPVFRVVSPTPPPTALPTVPSTGLASPYSIVGVVGAGDVATEGIEIQNISNAVHNLEGWTLSDDRGNTYRFPYFQMFLGRHITVYTREGDNSPSALFWNLSAPVWLPGTTATIGDELGNIIVQYQVK
jgi:hypothetical protein